MIALIVWSNMKCELHSYLKVIVVFVGAIAIYDISMLLKQDKKLVQQV